jgi:hypothetical protein
MEAGGMIAHARSSQIRNAENKYVLDDNILSNSAEVCLSVDFTLLIQSITDPIH